MKRTLICIAGMLLFGLSACQKPCECPVADEPVACGVPEQAAAPEAAAPEAAAPEAAKPAADETPITAGAEEIVLPKPVATDVTLTKALEERRSVRSYDAEKNLKLQDVSNLLWSAYGVNRPDGKRTAPSARNMQSATIYALFEKGAYKYDHAAHKLIRLSEADLRPLKVAPMELLVTSNFTGDNADDPAKAVDYATIRGIDTGVVAQNVHLYCAAAGLATVIRMQRTRDDAIVSGLQLTDNDHLIFNMAIGYEQK